MIPQLNDPVRIPSLVERGHGGTGRVELIDWRNIYAPHKMADGIDANYYPIQVALDTPYDSSQIWRTNLDDIEINEGGE
jgi:hypothetical protein